MPTTTSAPGRTTLQRSKPPAAKPFGWNSEPRRLARGCAKLLRNLAARERSRCAAGTLWCRADPATNKADEARETADWTLLEEAERHRLPVLGICYGLQSLNVYRGGSLVQDLLPLPVNHSAGRKVAVAHTADIAPREPARAL